MERLLKESIKGQEPSWKNALTRCVISKVEVVSPPPTSWEEAKLEREYRHKLMMHLGKISREQVAEGRRKGYYNT